MQDVKQIGQRQELFRFVEQHLGQLTIAYKPAYLIAAENYLDSNLVWNGTASWLKRYRQALWFSWIYTQDFHQLQSGLNALQLILCTVNDSLAWLKQEQQLPTELQSFAQQLRSLFDQLPVQEALIAVTHPAAIVKADFLLRHTYRGQVQEIFNLMYELDAYCALARFTTANNWTYPEVLASATTVFEVSGLWHPLLQNEQAVQNDFKVQVPSGLTLLTGGNMSGKTTFMKACGIAIYLAHLGLPVPAQAMRVNFFSALIVSIHLSDRLELGYSHFYTELMQVKMVLDALTQGNQVCFLADELFRSTNPDDGLACSYRVIDQFIQQRGNLFLLSSHLPRISEPYQVAEGQVQFACFRTYVREGKLQFTYILAPGVAIERTALLLLEQAGIQ